jgi:hypothetical protein
MSVLPGNSLTTNSNVNSQLITATAWLGRLVKLLLAFASAVIPGFSLLKIHDQEGFCSLLDMYVFRNGASSLSREGSVFLCRHYVCCTVVSARVYPRGHSIQSLWSLCTLCHCTILINVYTRYTEVSCQCRLVQQVMP